jgi:hypothetical protein
MYTKSSNSQITFKAAVIFAMLLLVALPVSAVFAEETGYASPSTAITNGKNGWSNPVNSFASDDAYTSTAGKKKQLRLGYFNISQIQGNSTITGIAVDVEGYTDGREVTVQISGDGGTSWTTAKQTNLTGTESTYTLGGTTGTWGKTWVAESFTNTNFMMRVVSSASGAGTVYIDHVRVKVYFTPTDGTLTVDAVSTNYGTETTTLTATFVDTDTSAAISGKTIDFNLFGNNVGSAVTDVNGVATLDDVDISGLASNVYPAAIYAFYAGGDYDATYAFADLTIVGIPLTVTADPQTKYYGHFDPTLTYQVDGSLEPGDAFDGELLRDTGETLGEYYINQGTLSAGPNYSITYIGDFLEIVEAPLTVTPDNQSKLDTDPAITVFAFDYDGFATGEGADALSTEPTCALEVGADQSVPGVYDIICSGGKADNYFFNYVNGTLTVNAANTPPTDITLSNNTVHENGAVGTPVGTLTNNDPNLLDIFTYSLVETGVDCPNPPYATDNASFAIDGDQLETSALLNFEAKNSYKICVQVDDGNGGLWQKEFTISVLDLPETFTSSGAQDGWILESSETSGKGGKLNKGATTLRLGDDAANRQYRAILSFDTSSLPEGADITSVTLTFKYAGKSGTLPFNTHGKLLADISMGGFKNNPALQLGDFKAGASRKNVLAFTKNKVNNWYSQSLDPLDFQFINTAGVTQFRLRFKKDDNNDFGADFLKIYSGDANEANRPQLIVEYELPGYAP